MLPVLYLLVVIVIRKYHTIQTQMKTLKYYINKYSKECMSSITTKVSK